MEISANQTANVGAINESMLLEEDAKVNEPELAIDSRQSEHSAEEISISKQIDIYETELKSISKELKSFPRRNKRASEFSEEEKMQRQDEERRRQSCYSRRKYLQEKITNLNLRKEVAVLQCQAHFQSTKEISPAVTQPAPSPTISLPPGSPTVLKINKNRKYEGIKPGVSSGSRTALRGTTFRKVGDPKSKEFEDFVAGFYAGGMMGKEFLTLGTQNFDAAGKPVWSSVQVLLNSKEKAEPIATNLSEIDQLKYFHAFNGLKVIYGFHTLFPRQAINDLETQCLATGAEWFASGARSPWNHGSSKEDSLSQKLFLKLAEDGRAFHAHQLAQYGSLVEGSKANRTDEKAKTEQIDSLRFLKTKTVEVDRNFQNFAWMLAIVFGVVLSTKFWALQLGYMHNIYPPHYDHAGMVMARFNAEGVPQSIQDGDGFGKDIVTYQINGPDVWVYIACEIILQTGKGASIRECIGVKFKIRRGDAWGIGDNARFNCMHGVYPDSQVARNVHNEECTRCRSTLTLRNGLVSKFEWEKLCTIGK